MEAGRGLGDVEQLLPEIAQFVAAVLVVEGDEVGERAHRGVAKTSEIGRHVNLELGEQDGQLRLGDRLRVGRLDGVDERCAERGHDVEGLFCDHVEAGVSRGVTGEEPPIHPDPRPA